MSVVQDEMRAFGDAPPEVVPPKLTAGRLLGFFSHKKAMEVAERTAKRFAIEDRPYGDGSVDREKWELALALMRLYGEMHGPDEKMKWRIYAEMRTKLKERRIVKEYPDGENI
jgi:hypothetical protein